MSHPCSEEFDWVPEEYATEAYTLRRILDEAKVMNLFDIPNMSVTDDVPFESTIEYIEYAVKIGSLAVFCFHGIGGDYLVSSREYHQRIIDYLKANESDIWVATMVEIAAHLSVLPVEIAPDNSPF